MYDTDLPYATSEIPQCSTAALTETQKSSSEIAAECGMADQAHLTRLFRGIVGESPAAWRCASVNPVP